MINDELILRRLLWIRHGCHYTDLYADDGEMQCNKCKIDFKRMTPEQIKERFSQIGEELLRRESGITMVKP